jgi:hypothetical protein
MHALTLPNKREKTLFPKRRTPFSAKIKAKLIPFVQ